MRLEEPLDIDGRLDDAVYARVPPMTDFIQNDPVEGAPASERTEVWILFDDERVYLSARCWESRPDRLRATEMRRDNTNIAQDDNLAWAFDTFYDRRNGMLFEVNAAGGRMDGQTSNEGRSNFDWNPIWQVEATRFDGRWTVETAIPFKSLRYRPGPAAHTASTAACRAELVLGAQRVASGRFRLEPIQNRAVVVKLTRLFRF